MAEPQEAVPMPDAEAVLAIFKDCQDARARAQALLDDTFQKWRAATEEMKKALAVAPAAPAQGF